MFIYTNFGFECLGIMAESLKERSHSKFPHSDPFKTKTVKAHFNDRFKIRTVLAERGVKCIDFVGEFAFIPKIFENRGWMPLIATLVGQPFEKMIREFYANNKATRP